MFLIKSIYIGKAKTKKVVYWGKMGNYKILNYDESPEHSWAVVNAIGLIKNATNRLDKIPDRLWIEGSDFILMKSDILKILKEKRDV